RACLVSANCRRSRKPASSDAATSCKLPRLLRDERYVVVRGQGGEGKAALAAEFARWMVRSHRIRRAAFLSVEMHSSLAAVLDAIGRQHLPVYAVAMFDYVEQG